LNDGRVLVAGGSNSGALGSAQLYDPQTATWSNAASMHVGRAGQAAVRLGSGKVLVAGGVKADGTTYTASAEVYDPSDGTWTEVGNMATARFQPTMTLLEGGGVLVAGGVGNDNASPLASAEIYDPSAGSFSPAGTMSVARASATATLLPSGKVLVAGGYDGTNGEIASAELYDPAGKSWSTTDPLATARDSATATALPNGDVLVAGGDGGGGHALASAELYHDGAWQAAGTMTAPRQTAAAALLTDGTVLVTGGESSRSDGDVLGSAELYDPTADSWTSAGTLAAPRKEHTLTALGDGRALVVGGNPGGRDTGLTGVERFSLMTAPTLTDATFGTQLVGSTSDVVKSVLTNTGKQSLHVTGVSKAGADFTVVDDSCTGATVLPGDTCEVSVQFSPSAGGTRTGTLTVTDNETAAGATTAALRGTGDAPAPAGGGDTSGGNAAGGSTGAAAPAAPAAPAPRSAVAGTTTQSGAPSAARPGTRATCVAKTKSGRTTVTCRVTWPTRAAVAINARLMRGSTKLASASATARGGHATITLRPARRLRSGRYTVVIARRGGAPVLRQGMRVS
jgi:hypothetical protein